MSTVTKLKDQWDLVDCTKFPKDIAVFPKYKQFNPMQSRVFEIYKEDANSVLMARTSAGKTACAEMYMSDEIRRRGGKAMFLGPLRALMQEKIDEWTDDKHHFNGLNSSICTGDYRLTSKRRAELEKANLILMTSEMLNSRCRNYRSENNQWLKDIGTLVVDEAHLLTVPGRGDHLEVGLMKFAEVAPNARIVFLSATIPNAEEISGWLSNGLTGRDTYFVDSEYRPVPLGIHYQVYDDTGSTYREKEEAKIEEALDTVHEYKDDKFLVFVHSKDMGNQLTEELERSGTPCQFHNADLDKNGRIEVERNFRSGRLRVIVATSTLAWGLNLPARRVLIAGIHRGLTEVEWYDIAQMMGRAGRIGLDDKGDCHILVPGRNTQQHIERISTPKPITSRLLDHIGEVPKRHYKTLAFHLVSEIHHGNIQTTDHVTDWYKRSLAAYQSRDLNSKIVNSTLESLEKINAVKEEFNFKGKGSKYETTAIGSVSSMFYYSPYDVADLRRNFQNLFQLGLEGNDMALAMALGDVDSFRGGIVSRAEREEMHAFAARVMRSFAGKYDVSNTPEGRRRECAIKGGYAYYSLLKGLKPGRFRSLSSTCKYDFPRLEQVLNTLDGMGAKWNRSKWFELIRLRMQHGVSADVAYLAQIPKVGATRGKKLLAAGLKTPEDIAANPEKVKDILGDNKTSNAIIDYAIGSDE